jgi:hypothetical protein
MPPQVGRFVFAAENCGEIGTAENDQQHPMNSEADNGFHSTF